eukprot:scaffold31158_cov19-Tisochrysis_lutea.AAC.1
MKWPAQGCFLEKGRWCTSLPEFPSLGHSECLMLQDLYLSAAPGPLFLPFWCAHICRGGTDKHSTAPETTSAAEIGSFDTLFPAIFWEEKITNSQIVNSKSPGAV